MNLLTLQDFDVAIEIIERPTDVKELDTLTTPIGLIFRGFKQSQVNLINELLEMYDSASEHNIDVSRQAIVDLAHRLVGTD